MGNVTEENDLLCFVKLWIANLGNIFWSLTSRGDPGDKWQNKDSEAWQDDLYPRFQFQPSLMLVSGSSPVFTSWEFRRSLIYVDNISSSALCSLLNLGSLGSSLFHFQLWNLVSPPILYYDNIQKGWNKCVQWRRQVVFAASGFLTVIVWAFHCDGPKCSPNTALCPQGDHTVHPHPSRAEAFFIYPSSLPRRDSTKFNKWADNLYAFRAQIRGHALSGLWVTDVIFTVLSSSLSLFRHLALIFPPSSLYPPYENSVSLTHFDRDCAWQSS